MVYDKACNFVGKSYHISNNSLLIPIRLMISLGSRIRELRETNNLSQEQLGHMLGISRPIVAYIEAEKRKLKPEELRKLAELFDTSIDFLLSGEQQPTIAITAQKEESFKHLILYILSKVGAKYNVGKVVLYKLLYFSEFDFFELHQQYIAGYPFIKLPMGPAPLHFDQLIQQMKSHNEIISFTAQYGEYYQQRYIANTPVDENWFTQIQRSCIDEVLQRYSDLKASEISKLSHEDKPRQITNDMNIISYDLVKFREYPYSILAREQKKENTQKEAMFSGFFSDLANEPDLYEDYR